MECALVGPATAATPWFRAGDLVDYPGNDLYRPGAAYSRNLTGGSRCDPSYPALAVFGLCVVCHTLYALSHKQEAISLPESRARSLLVS